MKSYRNLLLSVFGGTLLFLLFFGIGFLRFGSVGAFMAFINGQPLYLSPRLLDLGSHDAGAEIVAVFSMTNLASRDISVVGESSSCDCAFSEKIPIVIPSGKTVDLKVNVRLPRYDSFYDQTLVFMVAEPSKLGMHPVRVTATVHNLLPRPVKESESMMPTMAPLIDESKD